MAIVAAAPGRAWAVCDFPGGASFNLAPLVYNESAALEATWSAPTGCPGPIDHYRACVTTDGTGAVPTLPTTGFCLDVGPTTYTAKLWVHRSAKSHGGMVFACLNAGCSTWINDGAHTDEGEPYVSTDAERWVITEVGGYDDAHRVVDDTYASASAAMMYPAGFARAAHLGIWWSTSDGGTEHIQYKWAEDDDGWWGWNTYGGWSTETTVASSVTSGATLGIVTHPWVIPTQVGNSPPVYGVRMHVQADDDGGVPTQVFWLDAADESGEDFNLECTDTGDCDQDGGSCAYGDACDYATAGPGGPVCSDGSSGCYYLNNVGHGRLLWDYIANGPVEFLTDAPSMLITGSAEEEDTGSCEHGSPGVDDVYWADWDGSTWEFSDTSTCTDAIDEMLDWHDPGVIPLPNGEFKAYTQINDDSYPNYPVDYQVCYYNPTLPGWEDCTPIELRFASDPPSRLGSSSAASPDLHECLENIDALVYVEAGNAMEGAFFRAIDITHDASCFDDGGILFAEHRN